MTDLETVQCCPCHAVILGQAHHHDLCAVPDQAPQPRVPRALDVGVVKEGGVGVYQGVGALLNNLGLFRSGQTRMEIGAWNKSCKASNICEYVTFSPSEPWMQWSGQRTCL